MSEFSFNFKHIKRNKQNKQKQQMSKSEVWWKDIFQLLEKYEYLLI